MNRNVSTLTRGRDMDELRHMFTVEEANRSLVYIERIVHDIVVTYERAVTLRERLDRTPTPENEERYERAMETLTDFVEELGKTGADIRDFGTGLVDFPARLDDREVCLSWRIGEPEVMYWHAVDETIGGRREIEQMEY